MRFSTNDVPEKDRQTYWREVFGHAIAKVDIEPLVDTPFHASVALTSLPDCHLIRGNSSPVEYVRTRALMADGNDDVFLTAVLDGAGSLRQRGREVALAQGEATLGTAGDIGRASGMSRYFSIRMPLHLVKSMAPAVEDRIARRIERDNPALRLLTSYVETEVWRQGEVAGTPELGQTLANHVLDLVALTIGASTDAAALAAQGGAAAARRALLRSEIDKSFLDPDFSLPTLARQVGVSTRYVQRLLEGMNSSFVKELTDRRLKRAFDLLRSPCSRHLSITDVALDCGFATMAHFHRLFRRRYGATPGALRNGRAVPSAS
jgi:AraC-like DNA-binding protein